MAPKKAGPSRFLAALNIPTVDLGVPLLSMHSPFEAAAKADVYMAHRAFTAFFSRSFGPFPG